MFFNYEKDMGLFKHTKVESNVVLTPLLLPVHFLPSPQHQPPAEDARRPRHKWRCVYFNNDATKDFIYSPDKCFKLAHLVAAEAW